MPEIGTFFVDKAKAAATGADWLAHFEDSWGELVVTMGLDPSGVYYLHVAHGAANKVRTAGQNRVRIAEGERR